MHDAYVEFEERFRGDSATVREEQRPFLRFFEHGPVVDLGCGRGEFVALLREKGLPAWGVDVHPQMVALGRAQGLDIREESLLDHLAAQPSASLGGIFMAHVIEHLSRSQVLRLAALAADRLCPGGVLLVETLNPQCVFAHAPFTMDLSHEWPIHPQTLQFLLEAHGLGSFELVYRQYLPPGMLDLVEGAPPPVSTPFERTVLDALRKMQLVLDLSFKNFIYALAARKPETSN